MVSVNPSRCPSAQPAFEVPTNGTHAPPLQAVSAAQALLQAPQCALSMPSSTHFPAHSVVPVGQDVLHAPATQTFPLGQALPQEPQFAGSELSDTHAPEHNVVPRGHAHAPLAQTAPAMHAVPQVPQFATFTDGLVSQPLDAVWSQSRWVESHEKPHWPAAQVGDAALAGTEQAFPQAPQLAMSSAGWTSQPLDAVLSQSRWVESHRKPHWPAAQVAEAALAGTEQAFPQAPQCATSVCGSAQTPPQHVSPLLHAPPSPQVSTHLFAVHFWPALQCESAVHSTQAWAETSQCLPVWPAQPSSLLQPDTHFEVAESQCSEAGQTSLPGRHCTHLPVATSQIVVPAFPAQSWLPVQPCGASLPVSDVEASGPGGLFEPSPESLEPQLVSQHQPTSNEAMVHRETCMSFPFTRDPTRQSAKRTTELSIA